MAMYIIKSKMAMVTALISLSMCGIGIADTSSNDESDTVFEEVIVTATRREINLQDTALSITALSEQALRELGAESIVDYANFVPGLTLTDSGPSRRKYVIRGVQSEITAGDSASTVAQYLDDIPLTAFGVNQPDPILVDIQRVEVLRGPQGTLYGASSMGGTVRTITNKPDFSEFSGATEARLSATKHGGFNYGVNGVVNLPVSDEVFALRAVASYENYDGFIDNVVTGQNNVNSEERFGGRLMARLAPAEGVDVVAYYMHQQSDIDASWRTDVSSGELLQATSLLESYQDDLDILNLTANFTTAIGLFTSASSYYDRDDSTKHIDQEYGYALGFLGPLGPGAFADGDRTSDGFAQEVRFVSSFNGPFQMVMGGFYNNTSETSLQNLYDVNGISQSVFPDAPAGNSEPVFEEVVDKDLKDKSVFGEFSFKFLPGLEATVGIRYYDIVYTFTDTVTLPPTWLGPFIDPNPAPSVLKGKADGTNLKFHLGWDISDDVLVYAQAAEGFRRGGTNIASTFRSFVPEAYDPDSLWSYELGWKSTWNDGRLVFNGALYQIDWSDIQIKSLLVGDNGLGGSAFAYGVVNSGEARIRGLELETLAQLNDNLRLTATLAHMNSELIEDAPGLQPYRGLDGDDLPGNPAWQGSVAVEYFQPVGRNLELWLRADATYIGDRNTELRPFGVDSDGNIVGTDANPDFFTMNGYTVLGIRAALRTEKWEATLFVNNLTDKQADQLFYLPFGQTAAGVQKITIRPQTIGLSLRTTF